MKKNGRFTADSRPKGKGLAIFIVIILAICLLAALASAYYLVQKFKNKEGGSETTAALQTTAPGEETEPSIEETQPPVVWEPGFIATMQPTVERYNADGTLLDVLVRGTEVEFTTEVDSKVAVRYGDTIGYLQEGANIVSDAAQVIPAHTLYVRTTVNLRDIDGRLLEPLADKGAAVEITGYDYLLEDGSAHMYQVKLDEAEGYIMPWYLAQTAEDALANYGGGTYALHESRGDSYGGGDAADLDYFPRQKGPIEGNEMPSECRTLYLVTWCLGNLDAYIDIAKNSGINAFVVDITDGASIGYAADVMKANCPSAVRAANNTVEEYQAAIQRLKDEGFYVIGRITTFNDTYFIKDHPEFAIADLNGNPLRLSGEYWPTAYNRAAWQYKVDLAVEAVQLMGFHEIQFDYVRFPDSTWRYENAGTIDFRNTYGESKAQAIQRFLMYATDILHEQGVYVSADVYGESAFTYVTAYGQYWPAISNVVDAISGMPYPDHFSASGDYRPWEHPYDTLNNWGKSVMARQGETATPAAVRTWIQAYNAIREPYNTYGPEQVAAQIRGLRDAGCTGGYLTWNAASSIDKYRSLMPAFGPVEEEE